MEIHELRTGEEEAWDSYVYESDASTFYHQIGWRNVVENTYEHKPHYLVARGDDGGIVGVLPLFLLESRVFGRKLISVPFAPYGGVCADDAGVGRALMEEGKRVARVEGVDYFEIRGFENSDFRNCTTNGNYLTFIIDLDQGMEQIWKNMRKDKKKGVKKAKNGDVSVEWSDKSIDDFYDVYTKNMRDLGTPVHSYTFFQNILLEFPKNVKILNIKYGDVVICSKFLLNYSECVISMWGSTLGKYRKYHPYDLANWEAMVESQAKGYRYFDFGRCLRNSGVFEYKMGWRGEQKPLFYQFYLAGGGNPPDFTQTNPKRKVFARVWRKLPLSVTRVVGPAMRRDFP
ncbi:MAG: FemAB family XrtA/PEP-CTERM system-associated protein [Methanosarcinaceae archaeon]